MAIYCSDDETQHPDTAKVCMQCGRPLRGQSTAAADVARTQWEYRDEVVSLDFTEVYPPIPLVRGRSRKSPGGTLSAERIVAALNGLGRDGWQPDHPTDLSWLMAEGRVACEDERAWKGEVKSRTYKSVTLRLKRLLLNAHQ